MLLRILVRRGSPDVERFSPERTRKMQEERLRSTVASAYENTKFWRERFDAANLAPGDIKTLDDLSKIPLVTKKDLLERDERDRLSEDPSNCRRMSTSGSTGGPLSCYYSKRYGDYLMSISLFRLPRMVGKRIFGSKIMGIAYALPSKGPDDPSLPTRTPPSRAFGPIGSLLRPVMRYFYKTVYIGYGIEDALPEIVEYRPRIIHGTPTYLRLLADAANAQGIGQVRPKAVSVIGEPFDEPTREYLDETFECESFSAYGANEFGLLAVECRERKGMHILTDVAIVEVLKDGKPAPPGESGEIVVTSLLNDAMPLIRYSIGDLGVLSDEQCPCGMTMPILASVEGRTVDHIRLADGRLVSPKRIMTIMHQVKGFPRAQLVQEETGVFSLRVYADGPEVKEATVEFIRQLKLEVRDDASVTVTYENPERLRAKFRPVLSRVSAANQDRRVKLLTNVS